VKYQAVRVLTLTLTLTALSLTACLGTNRPAARRNLADERRSPPATATEAEVPEREKVRDTWLKVSIGRLPAPTFYGYLRTRTFKGESAARVRWIYDHDWNLVGSMGPDGVTTRFDPRGRVERLGHLSLEDALRIVFDVRPAEGEVLDVHYGKLPRPRG
jgi:hypothetical protein